MILFSALQHFLSGFARCYLNEIAKNASALYNPPEEFTF